MPPADEVEELGLDAELGDGERAELDLEPDEPADGRLDRRRHRPAPWSAATVSAIRRRTPSRKEPVPTAGSATVTAGEASPAGCPNRVRSASSTSRTIAPTTSGGV